jgi:hypothetical protein
MEQELKIGDRVLVPNQYFDEFEDDCWVGRIIGFKDEYVQVSDQDNDIFDVKPEHITLWN